MAVTESAIGNSKKTSERETILGSSDVQSYSASDAPEGQSELALATPDVIAQFKANLQQVESLTRRLGFVLSEVSYIIRR